jgi:hypothetical protein
VTLARLARSPVSAAVAAVAALAAAFALGGAPGLGGMALGLVGAMFGATGLVLVMNLVGTRSKAAGGERFGVIVPVLVFLLKIPMYALLGTFAQRIGGAAFGCFLAGVVLVYFGLVAWASAR